MTQLRNIQYLAKTLFCGQCSKFRQPECRYAYRVGEQLVYETDTACDDFEPRREKKARVGRGGREKGEKRWTLTLYAKVPSTVKPCGFYGDMLTEALWLPYTDEKGNISMRPSVVIRKKNCEPQIKDFYKAETKFKGVFPAQDMASLMSVHGAQMIASNAVIEPQKVDAEIDEAFKKHLEMLEAERILCKRWIEGTFFYDCFDAFPILNVLGVSESGKSRLNLLNLALCYHAEGVIDPTEAGIFRSKEEDKATLCIDEAEYLNNPHLYSTLRVLINASYSKHSGYVTRYDEVDGKRVKRRFDLYSPMSVTGIGGLEGVTLSRAFRIVMRKVDRDFPKANPDMYGILRDKLYVIRVRSCFDIYDSYQKIDISNIVTARFHELFKPLFMLTTIFGSKEEWEILSQWCSEYQQNFRVEALNVAEEEIVLICLSKLEPKIEDWFSLKDLADLVNAEYSRKVSSKYVSGVLYRLGLVRRKKYKGYTLVYAPKELIEESSKRIGVYLSDLPSPQTLPTPQPSQKPEEWRNVFKD